MKFLGKTKISKEYRESIEDLFKKYGLTNVDQFLNAIDKWLPEFKAKHKPPAKPPADAQDIRRELSVLQRRLDRLSTETKDLLRGYYRTKYPSPRLSEETSTGNRATANRKYHFDQRILRQSKETHLMRLDDSGRTCHIVEVGELISRLSQTCQYVRRNWRPRRGKPIDPRIGFTMHIMNEFFRFTGEIPKSSADSPFPELLGYILEGVSGKPIKEPGRESKASSHEKLIEATRDTLGRFFDPEFEGTLIQSKPDIDEI